MNYLHHPITQQSFAIIDREIGTHSLSPEEYAIVRRVIHSTADFEFKSLLHFSPKVIEQAIIALRQKTPIITDVSMVKQGIKTIVQQTFGNPIVVAVEQSPSALPGKTRTESGLLTCLQQYPTGIFVFGNAPTALIALCETVTNATPSSESSLRPSTALESTTHPSMMPSLVIGAPVGFVAVEQSKVTLAQTTLPHIRVNGRKGGSPVAAAIVNALLVMAWERHGQEYVPLITK